MLEPKEIEVALQDGSTRKFLLSKFPAIAGREIVTKYPIANMPKLGEYQQSEEVMIKLMAFVSRVLDDGSTVALTTRALVDNHVGDWETLARIEWAQLEYNTTFFGIGKSSGLSEALATKAAQWISQTLIPLLATSLAAVKPPSKS